LAEGSDAAVRPHHAETLGDIANYTDVVPVVQISEVIVERSDRCMC
jgi:hypothetical protein